jgi:hypothetical protein
VRDESCASRLSDLIMRYFISDWGNNLRLLRRAVLSNPGASPSYQYGFRPPVCLTHTGIRCYDPSLGIPSAVAIRPLAPEGSRPEDGSVVGGRGVDDNVP